MQDRRPPAAGWSCCRPEAGPTGRSAPFARARRREPAEEIRPRVIGRKDDGQRELIAKTSAPTDQETRRRLAAAPVGASKDFMERKELETRTTQELVDLRKQRGPFIERTKRDLEPEQAYPGEARAATPQDLQLGTLRIDLQKINRFPIPVQTATRQGWPPAPQGVPHGRSMPAAESRSAFTVSSDEHESAPSTCRSALTRGARAERSC